MIHKLVITLGLILMPKVDGQCTTIDCTEAKETTGTCPNVRSFNDMMQMMMDLDSKQYKAMTNLGKDINSSVVQEGRRVSQLNTSIAALKQEMKAVSQLNMTLTEMKQQITSVSQVNTTLYAVKNELQETKERLQTLIPAFIAQGKHVSRLNATLASLTQEVRNGSQLNKSLDELKQEVKDTKSLLKIMTNAYLEQSQQVVTLNTTLAALREEVEQASRLNTSVFMLKQELQETKDVLQQLTKEIKEEKLSSCWDFWQAGANTSGIYNIRIGYVKRKVYCDMNAYDGGWLVFQRRIDGNVSFYRNWNSYMAGFGDLEGEFWLGNKVIYQLTSHEPQELRIELEDFDGETAYAEYSSFSIGPESVNFKLSVAGYNGTAGDSLLYHNGRMFSTFDRDNDMSSYRNCAINSRGAWWYKSCDLSNLNGPWVDARREAAIIWYTWKRANVGLKSAVMMMRPTRGN